jgi:hypothetical protein
MIALNQEEGVYTERNLICSQIQKNLDDEEKKEIDMQTRRFNNFLFHGKFDTVVDTYRIILCNVSQLFVTNCPKCHS